MNNLTLIKHAHVFTPEDKGVQDVMFAGHRVLAMGRDLSLQGQELTTIDATGKLLLPGLVDSLVHITGGGGEGGFHTRTPQMNLTDATKGGVTTLVGALGTDATTRTLPDLLAKAGGLHTEGLSVYCYTGSYQLPARTITGSVTDDIVLIDKFIGVGEVAIADHRSSQPTARELMRLASEARVGGMLSGKAGIVSIHVGDGTSRLDLLEQVVTGSDIPASQFYPTHINRNLELVEAGIAWSKRGGYLDMTTSTNAQFIAEGEVPAAKALALCLERGVPVSQLTMSSDGNASLPVFDDQGRLIGLEVGQVATLYASMVEAVKQYGVSLPRALASVSRSPADILGLPAKGRIEPGADADLLLVNADTLSIESVYAKGQLMVDKGEPVVLGTFE
ncbi:beta-aspartyl-peptidase [Bowmanella dokdonensis]|uniref:Isoaspartyl dipeptidase n=1 Tax=Bowmanella dokdonensis TaxID=751969 RepID=A0A939IR00_9ALTE|nr:beta-aspartyl-peptidase [Bowmanella dokdonensis]MBN7825122.1 beta-aspartyl-peptidase [Bowmanella dokdonensis]